MIGKRSIPSTEAETAASTARLFFCDAIAEPSLLLPSVVVDIISSGTIIHDELSELSVGGMIDRQV